MVANRRSALQRPLTSRVGLTRGNRKMTISVNSCDYRVPKGKGYKVEGLIHGKLRAALMVAVLVGLLSASGGCFHREAGAVKVGEAHKGKVSRFVTATGTLEPADPVYVSFPVDVTIASLEVRDGDYVEAGRVLARLDEEKLKESLASARANYLAAGSLGDMLAAQYQVAGAMSQNLEAAYRYLLHLAEEMREVAGIVVDAAPLLIPYLPPEARQGIYELYEGLRGVLGEMQGARLPEVSFRVPGPPSSVAEASAAGKEAAGYRLRRLEEAARRPYLTSPVAGHVVFMQPSTDIASQLLRGLGDLGGMASILASFAGFTGLDLGGLFQGAEGGELRDGSRVAAGSPVFQVVDLREMKVRVQVEEADALMVRKGQQVRIYLDALPGKTFTGRVESVGVRGERGSGGNTVFPVVVRMDRTEEELRIGLNATVDLEVESREETVVVPYSAVVEVEGRSFVYVVADGRAVLREVRLGIRERDLVEVISGLEEGESLVVEDVRRVKEGMRVH